MATAARPVVGDVLVSAQHVDAFDDSVELRRHMLDELRRVMGWEATFITRLAGPDLTITDVSGDTAWIAPDTTVPLDATLCFRLLSGAAPFTDRASQPGSGYHDAPTCAALGVESYSGHIVRRRDGSVYGTLCAIDHGRRLATDDERRLGETFARLLAWELEREETLEEVSSLARTDPLTGLANRLAFYEGLRGEVQRARRHGRPLALMLIDIDHFKAVNDAHGHPTGDAALAEIAGRVAALARDGELVARVGGEEFAWLLPETGADGALAAAERVRRAVSETPVSANVRLTISAGVTDLAQAGVGDEMFRLADRALYWAKENGRNRCISYSPEILRAQSAADRDARVARSQAAVALRALARAIDARDRSTQEHSERVARLAAEIAAALGWTDERVEELREAALVHDVGKTGVPDAILFKPGRLTDAEYERIKEHPVLGARIVAHVLTAEQVEWVRGHHERLDGGGYPDGLVGDAIPEGARIMALADAWDAMTSVRPYREPLSAAAALRQCVAESGRQFWPPAVRALRGLRHS